MLARVAFSDDDDEALRWTEAVRAAEGSEKLVGVLAEAVIHLSKVLGPRPWRLGRHALDVQRQAPSPLRTEVDLAWGTAAAMAGQAEGTEAIRAALAPPTWRR